MSKPSDKFRTLHTRSTKVDAEEKLKRLRTWKHWRRYGLRGVALEKRTKMDLPQVRCWAAELNFDLEGLA
jgi:hypothetical protein